VEYEIIAIENHAKYSLCAAYNIGAEKAKFSYLCFLHEDILFRTENWGKRLIDIMLSDKKIGLIGIMGSKFKSTYPKSSWGTCALVKGAALGQVLTINQNGIEKYINLDIRRNNTIQSALLPKISDAVCIDGVFLFTKKEIWQKCKFDEKLLKNYHGYDIDFSLQVFFAGYRVIVDNELLIMHYSGGSMNEYFFEAQKLIQKKWKGKLPVGSLDIKGIAYKKYWYNVLCWISNFVKEHINVELKVKIRKLINKNIY
jgi:GT2 family glycosyltransferase